MGSGRKVKVPVRVARPEGHSDAFVMANSWVNQMFSSSRAVRSGGIVRRAMYDVNRLGVLDEIIEEARDRGWHVIETGDQIVLLAHEGSLVLHC